MPECELPDRFCFFFQVKIASICNEFDLQPADSTPAPHSFVGSETCGSEPVSQETVRKLIGDYALQSCVFDPVSTLCRKRT